MSWHDIIKVDDETGEMYMEAATLMKVFLDSTQEGISTANTFFKKYEKMLEGDPNIQPPVQEWPTMHDFLYNYTISLARQKTLIGKYIELIDKEVQEGFG